MTMHSLSHIAQCTADEAGVTVAALRGPDRSQSMHRIRCASVYLSKRLTGKSYPEIGRYYSRDHTTMINADRKAIDLLFTDDEFSAFVARLKSRCASQAMPANDPLRLAVIEEMQKCSPILVQAVARFMGVKVED